MPVRVSPVKDAGNINEGDGSLLSKLAFSEKRRSFTANIQNQLNRMEWLVTALKLAKLDAGAVTIKRKLFTVKNNLQCHRHC